MTKAKKSYPLKPAAPKVTVGWRTYEDSTLGWQIVTINGISVYLACRFPVPGTALMICDAFTIASSLQDADAQYQQVLEDLKKQLQQREEKAIHVWSPEQRH